MGGEGGDDEAVGWGLGDQLDPGQVEAYVFEEEDGCSSEEITGSCLAPH
jgi:hypothetical protein